MGSAVAAPVHGGVIGGLSVAFALGAPSRLAKGAVRQKQVALHASLAKGSGVSVSTQIALLRRLLLGDGPGDAGKAFKQAGAVRKRVPIAPLLSTVRRARSRWSSMSRARTRSRPCSS